MGLFEVLHCIIILMAVYVSFSILKNEKRAGISPTPSLPNVRHAVIEMIKKHTNVTKHLKIAELGCGWGGLALKVIKELPNASVTGYEISPCPLAMSRLRALFNKNFEVKNLDFFFDSWNHYDVIICYLSPQHMEKIKSKLDSMSTKPLLISCSFALPGAEPLETKTLNRLIPIPVYAYR